MSDTVTVVKIYGINLGEIKEPEKLEGYADTFEDKHPEVRIGFFGPHDARVGILYHRDGFHEMYDNGAYNKYSMVVSNDDLDDYNTIWDNMLLDAAEDMGFKGYSKMDVSWMVVVSTYTNLLVSTS